MSLFKPIYGLHLDIGVSCVGGTWTYAELSEGIDNISEALNEVVQQYQFLAGQGYAKNHVTGMAIAYPVSGTRVLGDVAQDYICSIKYELDAARQSSMRLRYTDASSGSAIDKSIVAPCTICGINEWGGASTDDSKFSCEIRLDAKPTTSNVGVLGAMAVVSVAGETSEKTQVYVNPAITGTDTYVYKTAASVVLPQLGVAPGAGWAAWNGTTELTATTGQYIGIVEITSGGLSVKGGLALVTSKA